MFDIEYCVVYNSSMIKLKQGGLFMDLKQISDEIGKMLDFEKKDKISSRKMCYEWFHHIKEVKFIL